ncbi:serine/threonine-protein kinase [Streptomyces lycii]|uniref:Protein kinase n=1 Tax=Streptomyces lycii TaxID=2654337 RepID=A0ABQ7FCE7_9ACTN|nr:serine/threonine-protein kinase [Streptomyces lycii]KAF4406247.1 protein kinase [Streptomyces lycii]
MSDQRPTPPFSAASVDAALEQTGAAPLRPADPARIGPYLPLGLLGSGGMGRVHLARPADDSPGLAAVKVIRPEYAEDTEFRRRFGREASVHARVRTPHAPRLLGTGFDDQLLWMATEYLPGLSLADAIRDCGKLGPSGMWRLVAELGRALAALADAGIVHRDLKPSNVILSATGAHVIDFGISQAADSSAITTSGTRVGTPAFMAPEYLRDGRCDTASDVFSLAGTLVYAATGHAPFGDGTGVDVMHRVAFEEPRAEVMAELAAADPSLAALLSACLAKDSALRPGPRQLIGAAEAHALPASWQEPLHGRLLARQQACRLLGSASAEQTGRFRPPERRPPAPAPVPGFGPPPSVPAPAPAPAPFPAGRYGPPAGGAGAAAGRPVPRRRRRPAPYLAAVAGLTVCALAVGAFLLTRPDGTVSAPPAATGSTTPEVGEQSPLPAPSGHVPSSPSDRDEDDGDTGGRTGGDREAEAERSPDRPGGAGGSGGAEQPSDGTDTTPTRRPAPSEDAGEPTTPAWISGCRHYSGTAITRYGDKGSRVLQVQCMLTKRGYSVGGAGVDGEFGDDTRAAVRLFQSDRGLAVDGEVGPNTWRALRRTS